MRKQELYNIMVGSVVGDANELYTVDEISTTLFTHKEYKGSKKFRFMSEAMRKSGRITIKLVTAYGKSKVVTLDKFKKLVRV